MIPNIQPPPTWMPQGWTPNALRPQTAASGLSFPAGTILFPGGVPLTVTQDFTNAQLAALSGTPSTMFPAPGAGFAWQVLYAWAELVKTVASGGPAPTFRVRYTGTTVDLVAAFVSDIANAPRSFFSPSISAVPGINSTTIATLANLGVDIDLSAGGIGASNATARVGICAFKRQVAGY